MTLMNRKTECKYKFYETSENKENGLKLRYNIDLLYCLHPTQGTNSSFTLVTVIFFFWLIEFRNYVIFSCSLNLICNLVEKNNGLFKKIFLSLGDIYQIQQNNCCNEAILSVKKVSSVWLMYKTFYKWGSNWCRNIPAKMNHDRL